MQPSTYLLAAFWLNHMAATSLIGSYAFNKIKNGYSVCELQNEQPIIGLYKDLPLR